MPADVSVLNNPEFMESFQLNWASPGQMLGGRPNEALQVGLGNGRYEIAGRQIQYEKFYAGPSFIRNGHSYREAPWAEFDEVVDTLVQTLPGPENSKVEN